MTWIVEPRKGAHTPKRIKLDAYGNSAVTESRHRYIVGEGAKKVTNECFAGLIL